MSEDALRTHKRRHPAEGNVHRGEIETNCLYIDRVLFGLLLTIFIFIHSLSYVDGHDDYSNTAQPAKEERSAMRRSVRNSHCFESLLGVMKQGFGSGTLLLRSKNS